MGVTVVVKATNERRPQSVTVDVNDVKAAYNIHKRITVT